MGLKIAIPGVTFTGTENPLLLVDSMLTQGGGSLLLVDMSHPSSVPSLPLVTPPTHGLSVPNLAVPQAAVTLGSGDAATLTPSLTVSTNVASGKMERTPKGGLHGLFSQVNDTSGNRASLGIPLAIRTYIEANPTHDFYFSVWGRMTRNARNTTAGGLTGYVMGGLKSAGTASEKEWATLRQLRTGLGTIGSAPTSVERIGFRNATGPITNFMASIAVSTRVSTWAAESLENRLVQWGPYGTSYVHDSPSWVFYRAYMEDLTVSGRNYVDLDVMDFNLYTQRVLTAGGRYYGDTLPTDPTALP